MALVNNDSLGTSYLNTRLVNTLNTTRNVNLIVIKMLKTRNYITKSGLDVWLGR